jgi:hypothetical protein
MTRFRFLTGMLLVCIVTATGAEAAKKSARPAEPMAQDTSLDNLKDAPKPSVLACEGPFARTPRMTSWWPRSA